MVTLYSSLLHENRHSVVGVPSVKAGKDVDLVKLKVFDAKLSLVDPFTVTSKAGNCY